MANFKQEGNLFIVDEGYVFKLKNSDMTCKTVRLEKYGSIDNYEIIVEPVYEEEFVEDEFYNSFEELKGDNNGN